MINCLISGCGYCHRPSSLRYRGGYLEKVLLMGIKRNMNVIIDISNEKLINRRGCARVYGSWRLIRNRRLLGEGMRWRIRQASSFYTASPKKYTYFDCVSYRNYRKIYSNSRHFGQNLSNSEFFSCLLINSLICLVPLSTAYFFACRL